MENKLIVSLSPHVHSGDSIQKNMYGVLIALIPALIVSFIYFGLGAAIVTVTSVAACVFFEWAITEKRKNNYM
jgi:electron transport complex protein RnfD